MVTIDVLVNTVNRYWLLSELQKGEWKGRMCHSGIATAGIGDDLLYHVDHAFAKKTDFSLKRSP